MAQNKRPFNYWSPIQAIRDLFGLPEAKPDDPDRSAYLKDLYFQHRNFDVKGIAAPGEATLNLAHVFVDVGLAPTRQTVSANPIPALRKNGSEERHSIWRFLLRQEEYPPNLVVLGAPGTGKTTLLKHITLTLTAPTQDAPRLHKTPIFLYSRDIAQHVGQNPDYSLLQAIRALFQSRQVSVPLNWLGHDLGNGRCLIMLDGLDEVADPAQRQQVVTWVQRQMQQHPTNQFVVTSRPFGYASNPLPDSLLLEVKPFTLEQVRQFVTSWYAANEVKTQGRDDEGVRRDAAGRATDLLRRLRQTPALLDMGVNPLLLTMIATIHRYRNTLPDQRVALYHEICDVFLGKRHEARGITYELSPSQKKRVLQCLAYEMMRRNLRHITRADAADIIDPALRRVYPQTSSEQFLQSITETSGLLIEHTAGVYSFAHQTFQEYLTAVHLKDQRLEKVLLDRVDDPWWHETIRLYAAQTNATNIIRACVMRETASIPALTLAVECIEEALEVEDDFRKIPAELVQSIENDNPEIRRIGAEVLLQLRLRRLVRLDESTYADRSLVTQAEYQLFLDELRAQGSYRQPDHWQGMQFASGEGQMPAAGVRPSDAQAFCNWLTERETGPWRFRLPTAQETARHPLNAPSTAPNDAAMGYWFFKDGHFQLAPSPQLDADVVLIQSLQWQIEHKLLDDWLFLPELDVDHPASERLRQIVLEQARRRAYSLLDLDRRLPFSADDGAEIGRFFSLVQDRTAEGLATEMEHALLTTKAHIDNPTQAARQQPLLEEIISLASQLTASLERLPFAEEFTGSMQQLMRVLGRAREQLDPLQPSMQSEFVSHRELVRHLNMALHAGQVLLNDLSNKRSYARDRLRIQALHHSLTLLQNHSGQVSTSRRQVLELLQILVDLYVDMAILDGRSSKPNRIPALEGIRIVREAAA
ncbi:MAG: NACHT domain-containing protein [Anaerolineaceae bacterium]|nr:NACHT domain-containing protein [Anaerolineaceae bacterium]